MRPATLIFVWILLIPSLAHADVYMKMKTMGTGSTDTWTQGKKQRIATVMPGLATVTIITRADKGVEWTIDPTLKMYDEKPIALPYTKGSPESSGSSASFGTPKDLPESSADDCDGEFTQVGTKTIAGFTATGYKMGCKNQPGGMITWMSPSDATWKRVEKELNEFSKARQSAMFANYPPKERKEFQEGVDMMKNLMGAAMTMKGIKIPKGVPLAMETEGEEGAGVMYEAEAVNFSGADPSLFEVPAGYQKVENLAMEQASKMMGVDIKKMYGDMGQMSQQALQQAPQFAQAAQAISEANASSPEAPPEETASAEEESGREAPQEAPAESGEAGGTVYED
ncbi:MAG TPA: hypothetical protein VL404_08440 [Candidatus Eisenbacteria bacterium]|nr:hypothetical protein [Candidatus Eisenbacteria bacterium]